MRKLSVLGVVLMAASAVTAFMLPKANADSNLMQGANSATVSEDGGGLTCAVNDDSARGQTCHLTVGSATTGAPLSSDGNGNTTIHDIN